MTMGNTDFLFKMPRFVDGAARIVDLFGDFDSYNISRSPSEADARALQHDMRALYEDARVARENVEKLMPGATKFFFDSMKAQSEHRQELERTVVTGNERRANRGQWMAYSIFIGVFVTGVVLTAIGIDVAGIIIAISSLAGVLALFFGRRKASDRELEAKR